MLNPKAADRRRLWVAAGVGTVLVCGMLWWSAQPPATTNASAATCSPKGARDANAAVVSTDVATMRDSDKSACYRWLEGDLQECEYVIKWLQQNSADEDARIGRTPTAAQLAERVDVTKKSLYCSIPSASQSLWTDAERFRNSFFPYLNAKSLAPPRAAASAAASGGGAAKCIAACPVCPTCPASAPAAPAPAPVVAPAASAPARGVGGRKEKRVISFGLYGADPKYVNGALRNAELTPSVFPGWVMRVYHDDSVPADRLADLRARGVELVRMARESGSIAGMFWRFLVADDPTVDRYIVRDSDSRLNEREARAVDAWIASGKRYHILRDHPSHSMATVSGGIWGGVHDPNLRIADKMAKHSNKNDYIQDMYFLGDVIYPLMLESVIAHDAYSCTACGQPGASPLCKNKFPHSVPFPTPRIAGYHCGQVFDANDVPRQGDIDIITRSPPPPECTPRWPTANTGNSA